MKGETMAYEKPVVSDLGSIAEHTQTFFNGGSGVHECPIDADVCQVDW